MQRLDRVATTLIGATAAMAALLTALGVSDDRLFQLLDSEWVFVRLMLAGAFSLLAVLMGLVAILMGASHGAMSLRRQFRALAVGLVAYMAALGFTLLAVFGESSVAPGRPMIDSVMVEDGDQVVISFDVSASSLDRQDKVSVAVFHSVDGQAYTITLRPDAAGSVKHSATVPLPIDARRVVVHAWRSDQRGQERAADCDNSQFATCAVISLDVSPPADAPTLVD